MIYIYIYIMICCDRTTLKATSKFSVAPLNRSKEIQRHIWTSWCTGCGAMRFVLKNSCGQPWRTEPDTWEPQKWGR